MARRTIYTRPKTAPAELLLTFLARQFKYLNEEQWLHHVLQGHLLVNSNRFSEEQARSYVMKQQDVVDFDPPRALEPPVPERFNVLFSDASLVVVNKPAGIPVAEGGRYCMNTLRAFASAACGLELLPVHRLDKETSGIVLFAKTKDAAKMLGEQFSCKEGAQKIYHVVVKGVFPAETVSAAFRVGFRCEGVPANSVEALSPLAKLRMKCFSESSEFGKPARTEFRLLSTFNGLSFLEAKLLTGRTHQIRLHCAALGFPVLGDKLYGEEEITDEEYLRRTRGESTVKFVVGVDEFVILRHMLHAASLQCIHPVTQDTLSFTVHGANIFKEECPFLSPLCEMAERRQR